MSAANGGQLVCSQATAELVRDDLREGIGLVDLGEHRLRDLARPERIFEVRIDGSPSTEWENSTSLAMADTARVLPEAEAGSVVADHGHGQIPRVVRHARSVGGSETAS
jgi:hypothetical protein